MKDKFIINCNHSNLLVAYVSEANVHSISDIDNSHFSFLATCYPPEFANVLDVVIRNSRNPDTYWHSDFFTIESVNCFDRIIFTRNCNTLSINRGGCSNMYMGKVDTLGVLPKLIRKEYKKYEQQNKNEE